MNPDTHRSLIPKEIHMAGAWGIAVALLAGTCALGAYLESGTGRDVQPLPPERIYPPPPPPPRYPTPRPENAVARLIRNVEVGTPYSHRGLTVYPLRMHAATGTPDIRPLDEALRHGWITILEKTSAEVGEVQVRNHSQHRILLLAGEILVGGRQNRIVRDDVLLPPYSAYVGIPVYCVEKDRWTPAASIKFESSRSLAGASIRKGAAAGAPQDAIWREVEEQSAKMRVESPTRDYQRIYDESSVRRNLDDYARGLSRVCARDTVGAVAGAGGDILGADLFSDPGLFAYLWDKILRSYAVDYVSWERHERYAPRRDDVRNFLDGALSATYRERYTPGAGQLWDIRGATDGAALTLSDDAVHVHLFRGYARPVPPPEPVPLPYTPRPYPQDRLWRDR